MKDYKEYPRLNLGCGFDYKEEYINIDFDKSQFKTDMVLNLEKAKLPFPDDSIQLIKASHILEHINNFIPLMKEIHRVLIPEGILYVKVPEFPCAAAIADPTHVRHFVPESFFLWTNSRPQGADTGNIGGLFEIEWIESITYDNGDMIDRGRPGGWFKEIEIELSKIGQNEESIST